MVFFVKSILGEQLIRSLLADWNPQYEEISAGKYNVSGIIPVNSLTSGDYIIEPHASIFNIKDYDLNNYVSYRVNIRAPHNFNTAHVNEPSFGVTLLKEPWELKKF